MYKWRALVRFHVPLDTRNPPAEGDLVMYRAHADTSYIPN